MMPLTTEQRRVGQAQGKKARAALIASTPDTTRPGSETTQLKVGDAVRPERAMVNMGTWRKYAGRNGWVAAVNTQTFPNGTTYVEIGVSWTRPTDRRIAGADAWFRNDELVLR